MVLDEAPSRCENTPGEEEESGVRVTPQLGLSPTPVHQEQRTEEQRLKFLVRACSSVHNAILYSIIK